MAQGRRATATRRRPALPLYMQTRLPNPHYIPEVQAQTTLVNFTVTEKRPRGPAARAKVVGKERPDLLEEQRALVEQQNEFTIQLKELEDDLLYRLANAEGDILGDEELIEGSRRPRRPSTEINAKKEVVAKQKEVEIAKAREVYRPIANARLAHLLPDRPAATSSTTCTSTRSTRSTSSSEGDRQDGRCAQSMRRARAATASSTRESIGDVHLFKFVSRGLFERHRLTFSTQLAIKILAQQQLFKQRSST